MSLKQGDRLREILASEAAKIITTGGIRDFQQAKRKASERIGNSDHGSLPSNYEIERAISSIHNTFSLDYDALLTEMRSIALTVMLWLTKFSPYLVGPVLEGTANENTPISLHISCDTVEEVIEALQFRGLDYRIEERCFKQSKDFIYLSTLIFCEQKCEIAATVFTLRQQHQHLKSKSQNGSMQRMNIKALTNLLNQADERPG